MSKALLIAWREIRWEIFGDRASVLRLGFFGVLPIAFVLTSPRASGLGILTLALQSTMLPALSGVALIVSTFTQEKENGTLVPLLAAPVHDIDIVVGKLMGMIGPVALTSAGSLAFFYALAVGQYGIDRVQSALPPEILYALFVLSLLYVLTAGSWVLIIAALVRTSRAGQQLSGLVVGLSIVAFASLGLVASRVAEGWALVGLGVVIVLCDAVALEVARRVWQRSEVIGRL